MRLVSPTELGRTNRGPSFLTELNVLSLTCPQSDGSLPPPQRSLTSPCPLDIERVASVTAETFSTSQSNGKD